MSALTWETKDMKYNVTAYKAAKSYNKNMSHISTRGTAAGASAVNDKSNGIDILVTTEQIHKYTVQRFIKICNI